MDAMRLRRKEGVALRPRLEQRHVEVCPICGHTSPRGEGRLVDPLTRREVCVRCGNEIRREQR